MKSRIEDIEERAYEGYQRTKAKRHLPVIHSPSSVEAWKDCARKFAWTRIYDFPKPAPNRFAQFGISCHSMAERYYAEGTPLDLLSEEGRTLHAGQHWWPKREKGVLPEHRWQADIDGHKFNGIVDIFVSQYTNVVFINDHKITGNLIWAKSSEDLQTDIQAITYARALQGERRAECSWLYYRRPPAAPKAVRVDVAFTPEQAKYGFAQYVAPYAVEIERFVSATTVEELSPFDLPANLASCEKYGGCTFKPLCADLGPLERIRSMAKQGDSKWLQERRARRGEGGGEKEAETKSEEKSGTDTDMTEDEARDAWFQEKKTLKGFGEHWEALERMKLQAAEEAKKRAELEAELAAKAKAAGVKKVDVKAATAKKEEPAPQGDHDEDADQELKEIGMLTVELFDRISKFNG